MVRINMDDLKNLQKNLQKLNEKQRREWHRVAANELAEKLLAKVVKATPVYSDIPDDVNAHLGGTLRRGWSVGDMRKTGDMYEIDLINPVEYASYVEHGHRGVYIPKLGKTMHTNTKRTEGRHMLEKSEKGFEKEAAGVLEVRLNRFVRDVFV